MRLRFAPSPTGFVHVGNARTALFNLLYARRNGGKLILRIEDTDVERSKKEYEENLIRDLKWMGIQWDEGPDNGGDFGPYRQSERNHIYKEHCERLISSGHAYYCFCTSEELQKEKDAAAEAGETYSSGYSGKCRDLDLQESRQRIAAGEEAAVRLKIPANREILFYDLVRDKVSFDSNLLSDPLIVRSSGMPAYNFSVVIDDHLMGINAVIRGEDHISNTARQILLYEALGFDIPKFAHLSMVKGEDNQKLSKRHGSTSIFQFRDEGYLPEALFNYLALLGWSPGGKSEVIGKEELFSKFNLKKVSKSAAIFDYQKLKWLNREHLRLKSDQELAVLLEPFLKAAGFNFAEGAFSDPKIVAWVGKAARVLSNYNYLLTEIASDFKQFSSFDCPHNVSAEIKDSPSAMLVVRALLKEVSQLESPVTFAKVGEIAKQLQADHGIKGKELYHPMRIALTGKESGIELKDFIPLIEEGSTLDISPGIKNMAARLATF